MNGAAATLDHTWHVLTFRAGHNTAVVLSGTLVLGLACGAIGTLLLLRKRSLIADALSHAALPGVCAGFLLAVALGGSEKSIWTLLPSAAVFGLLGVGCVHVLTTLPRVKEDAAIGVVLSVFFAGGIVLLSVIQGMSTGTQAGLKQFIFGQAATMGALDSMLIAVIALMTVILVAVVFKEMRLLCFDADFARSLGFSSLLLDGILLGLVTTVTVTGLYAVGAILMVALLIIPPAAARFWTNRLLPMMITASAVGGLGCYVGTAASAVLPDLPTGPSIVCACGVLFVVSMTAAPRRGLAAAAARNLWLSRTVARQHLLRALYEEGEISESLGAAVPVQRLAGRRWWKGGALGRVIRRLARRGEVAPVAGGVVLTERGLAAAERVVRSHRLWEFYLTSHADIAPTHVDHCADDIEHVLGDELVGKLERALEASGALAAGQRVPQSPHALADKAAAS